jgi:hypothetical protein
VSCACWFSPLFQCHRWLCAVGETLTTADSGLIAAQQAESQAAAAVADSCVLAASLSSVPKQQLDAVEGSLAAHAVQGAWGDAVSMWPAGDAERAALDLSAPPAAAAGVLGACAAAVGDAQATSSLEAAAAAGGDVEAAAPLGAAGSVDAAAAHIVAASAAAGAAAIPVECSIRSPAAADAAADGIALDSQGSSTTSKVDSELLAEYAPAAGGSETAAGALALLPAACAEPAAAGLALSTQASSTCSEHPALLSSPTVDAAAACGVPANSSDTVHPAEPGLQGANAAADADSSKLVQGHVSSAAQWAELQGGAADDMSEGAVAAAPAAVGPANDTSYLQLPAATLGVPVWAPLLSRQNSNNSSSSSTSSSSGGSCASVKGEAAHTAAGHHAAAGAAAAAAAAADAFEANSGQGASDALLIASGVAVAVVAITSTVLFCEASSSDVAAAAAGVAPDAEATLGTCVGKHCSSCGAVAC